MKEIESVTEGYYRKQVVQYDPSKILELCNRWSSKLIQEGETVIEGKWPTRVGGFTQYKHFHITHHNIALLAMITLQNYKYAHGKTPSDREFIALVNNATTILNPVDNMEHANPNEILFGIMFRLAYQQFPFQEGIYNVFPRHLLLYLYSKVQSPLIKLDSEAYTHFGLHIQEYMTIGLAFYGVSLAHAVFPRSFIENTRVESMKKYLTSEKVERFLSRTAADFSTFRDMCMREIENYPNGGTYRFNPLFDRPIIVRKDGQFCVPVPMLVPHVVTKGLYYDFLDLFTSTGSKGNSFAEWFGHAFEQYGGLLLKNTFGKHNVFQEPEYGKVIKRGPDWTVIQGDTAIVFEFRSGRLNKKAKVSGAYNEISDLVERNILEPLKKFPEKITDIKSGLTGIPANHVVDFLPCIVTYEPLYLHQSFLNMIQQELLKEDIKDFDYELMSIEDLEWLMSWAQYENPIEFLKAKRAKPEWKLMNIRKLIEIKIKEKRINDIRNRLLDRVFDNFWQRTIPELPQKQRT